MYWSRISFIYYLLFLTDSWAVQTNPGHYYLITLCWGGVSYQALYWQTTTLYLCLYSNMCTVVATNCTIMSTLIMSGDGGDEVLGHDGGMSVGENVCCRRKAGRPGWCLLNPVLHIPVTVVRKYCLWICKFDQLTQQQQPMYWSSDCNKDFNWIYPCLEVYTWFRYLDHTHIHHKQTFIITLVPLWA